MKQTTLRNFFARGLICASFLAGVSASALGATWNPDPSIGNPDQHRRLYEIGRHYAEVNFDADANLVGTSSKHPPNKKQHSTRESASYAYGLLLTGDSADRQRAQAILRKVLTLQDTEPASPTYGSFCWYAEDKKPQDPNSAAFDGMTLAEIIDLDRRQPSLDADLRKQIETAAHRAVEAVMKRNVDAGYTNIAFLSVALAAAGDKLLAVPGAGDFAQAKLKAIMALADDGEFAEYLSPTYYSVALGGAYASKKFAFSAEFSAQADAAIAHLWKQIALSYHAPSYQLGGPYCRAYGDNMLTYAAGLKYWLYLALDGNYPMPDTETDHDWDKAGLMVMAAVPVEPRPEFKVPPPAWRQWKAVGSGNTPVRELSQFRDGNFIFGTVAAQDEWKQKRNLVAHWRTDTKTPPGYRIGYCIDESNESVPGGFPGEKLHFYSQQNKNAALVVLTAVTDIPGYGGCSTLVCAPDATVSDAKDHLPLRIVDGAITAYLYPVTQGSATFQTQRDHRSVRVIRPWSNSDAVGHFRVLSYVIVFKPSDQPAPEVSDLKLTGDEHSGSSTATVDGNKLSVSFKY